MSVIGFIRDRKVILVTRLKKGKEIIINFRKTNFVNIFIPYYIFLRVSFPSIYYYYFSSTVGMYNCYQMISIFPSRHFPLFDEVLGNKTELQIIIFL